MVIAQVSRETNTNIEKHCVRQQSYCVFLRVSFLSGEPRPWASNRHCAHSACKRRKTVTTQDVSNDAHRHGVPNAIRPLPLSDNQHSSCKTPVGSDHETSGMVSLGCRRHVMPTGFRQVLKAIRFHLNKQMLHKSRNTCLIDVAFPSEFLTSSLASFVDDNLRQDRRF